MLLEVVGVDDEVERFLKFLLGRVSTQSPERLLGFLNLSNSDKVPRSLRGEVEDRAQDNRPKPLKGKGDSVRPLSGVVDQSSQNSRRNQLSNDEAHVGPAGKVGSQRHGQNLRRVGRGSRGEDSPGETAKQLTHEKHGGVRGEEDDEDEAAEEEEGARDDTQMAKLVDEVTVEKGSEERAHTRGVAQAGLPWRRQLVVARDFVEFSISLRKLGIRVEVAEQACVVTLHDNTGRDKETPEDSLWVFSNSLHRRQLVLMLGGVLRVIRDLVDPSLFPRLNGEALLVESGHGALFHVDDRQEQWSCGVAMQLRKHQRRRIDKL